MYQQVSAPRVPACEEECTNNEDPVPNQEHVLVREGRDRGKPPATIGVPHPREQRRMLEDGVGKSAGCVTSSRVGRRRNTRIT